MCRINDGGHINNFKLITDQRAVAQIILKIYQHSIKHMKIVPENTVNHLN
jgi:hypothetical protein